MNFVVVVCLIRSIYNADLVKACLEIRDLPLYIVAFSLKYPVTPLPFSAKMDNFEDFDSRHFLSFNLLQYSHLPTCQRRSILKTFDFHHFWVLCHFTRLYNHLLRRKCIPILTKMDGLNHHGF